MDNASPSAATIWHIFQGGVNTIVTYLNGVVGVARVEK